MLLSRAVTFSELSKSMHAQGLYSITHNMICHRCLHRASALRLRIPINRSLTTSNPSSSSSNPPAATSSGAAQPFSTPLSPTPNAVSLGVHQRPKPKTPLPVSSAPAGTFLKGLNFLKGREDPVALREDEYPEWLWHCLDTAKKGGDEGTESAGDEFCKSPSSAFTCSSCICNHPTNQLQQNPKSNAAWQRNGNGRLKHVFWLQEIWRL